MNEDFPGDTDLDEHESAETFPSSQLIVTVYCIGALLSLACAFYPGLSTQQSTNCLLISWLLALGALAVSFVGDSRKHLPHEPD